MKIVFRYLIIFFFGFFNFNAAQINKCDLQTSYFDDIQSVTTKSVKCLAENSSQPNTLFFVFARWCEPCLWHLPAYMELEKEYDVDLYVLLIDLENSNMTELAKDYVWERYPKAKIVVLKDHPKRGKGKKYKDFVNEITPSRFEKVNDMSKYIVLNNKGEVLLVTNWKDSESDPDWKDDRPMLKRLIHPLLQKRSPIVK